MTGVVLGLGEASARKLGREGTKVVVTDIKGEEGEQAVQVVADAGGEAIYLHHDVANETASEQMMRGPATRSPRCTRRPRKT